MHAHASQPAEAIDLKAFRHCLGQFATGVTIVTARRGDQLAGVTANSFSSLSLDPPLILWSLRRQSSSLAMFTEAESFVVNILAADQIGLATQFATSRPDKYDGVDWHPAARGAPVLGGAAAVIECRTYSVQDGGDHVIIIGAVERFQAHDVAPLAFLNGRFALSTPHPSFTPKVVGDWALGWG